MFRSPKSASKADTSTTERTKNRVPFLLKNDDSTSAFCTPARRLTRAMAKHSIGKPSPIGSSMKRAGATKSTKKKTLRQEAVDDDTPVGIAATASNGNSDAQPVQLQNKSSPKSGSKRKSKQNLKKTDTVDLEGVDGKEDSAAPINTSGRFVRALDDSINESNELQASGSKRRSKRSLKKTDVLEMGAEEDVVATINTSDRFVRSLDKSMGESNELNTTFDGLKEENGTTNKSVVDLTESPMPLAVKLNETFDAEDDEKDDTFTKEKDDTFTKEKDDTFTKDTENDGEKNEIVVKTPNASNNRKKTLTPKTEPAKTTGNKASGKKSNLSKLSHTIGSSRTKSTGNKLANPAKLKGVQLAKVLETAQSLVANPDNSTGASKAKASDSELRSQLQKGFEMYNAAKMTQKRDQNGQNSTSGMATFLWCISLSFAML